LQGAGPAHRRRGQRTDFHHRPRGGCGFTDIGWPGDRCRLHQGVHLPARRLGLSGPCHRSRAGHDIGLDDFDAASRTTPVIANIRPSGDTYLMEDFYYAGGLLGMLTRLKDRLDLAQINVSGRTWAESLEGAAVYNDDVIRPIDNPIYREGALAVLRGNLAPQGCVIKPSAAAPRFMKHTGPALVFDDYAEMKANID
ncbi:MAG: dihydroxy-acid dehydratase, partial [Alphaproteobacteria bacterium]|nr:dihydroxy-acid dehydratase [Alphaproteobacteria bacterium]